MAKKNNDIVIIRSVVVGGLVILIAILLIVSNALGSASQEKVDQAGQQTTQQQTTESQTETTSTENSSTKEASKNGKCDLNKIYAAYKDGSKPEFSGVGKLCDASKLDVKYIKKGSGDAAKTTEQTVSVNYSGWTTDGTKFDSSFDRGEAISFALNQVIPGWGTGLVGVPAGSRVLLTIPGDQAYGNTDNGDGRPFGTLVFVVDVLSVK